jgi:hypothetical protein
MEVLPLANKTRFKLNTTSLLTDRIDTAGASACRMPEVDRPVPGCENCKGGKAMTCRRWWWVGILMIASALGGCSGGDHDDGFPDGGACFLFREVEPNDTLFTAQFLDAIIVDDCFVVDGDLFDVVDVDSYRVLVQENLTLVVALDHSPLVDFDVQLFDADTGQLILDCGLNVVPEVCTVPFVVVSRDIAVDVVVTSAVGAGSYTLTLRAH